MLEISHVSVCASDFAQQLSAVPWSPPAVLDIGQDRRGRDDGHKRRPLERKTKPSALPHHSWGVPRPVLAHSPPCQQSCAIASGQGFAQQGVRIPGAASRQQ